MILSASPSVFFSFSLDRHPSRDGTGSRRSKRYRQFNGLFYWYPIVIRTTRLFYILFMVETPSDTRFPLSPTQTFKGIHLDRVSSVGGIPNHDYFISFLGPVSTACGYHSGYKKQVLEIWCVKLGIVSSKIAKFYGFYLGRSSISSSSIIPLLAGCWR